MNISEGKTDPDSGRYNQETSINGEKFIIPPLLSNNVSNKARGRSVTNVKNVKYGINLNYNSVDVDANQRNTTDRYRRTNVPSRNS